ncbi:MAG: 6-hydroxymethylpterin diphosphokinase MptE-like protein [Planctomycetota bacterium]|nr:6-hydroxymethylpterin diphosphokinase MptE-like protein [Planctomycetota bacterium]
MTKAPDNRVLEANLRALGARSARAAEMVRAAPDAVAAGSASLEMAPDAGLTGWVRDAAGVVRQLASRRGPREEGAKLAAQVDVVAHAATAVLGFGLGHHVRALAERYGRHGAVIVFEPDAALLRAVLSREDFTGVFRGNVVLLADEHDTGAIASALQGMEAVVGSGLKLLAHPASAARLGVSRERFSASLTQVMKAVRTNVVTTLVQVDVTVRNLLQNLRWYAGGPGVADLAGAAAGRAAVVVAAGPSLRRNVELLARPGVRDRVVIIAVQTVLKTLLARGIRPHFVTALDYHEMSRRFYEGLTPAEVEGVTLVAEPKANPAILQAFPGAIRCAGDEVLDQILGAGLARDMGRLPPGATVAHLAYYLARHLGCDPVVLIGQDLGFSDGQYYAPGAAIHAVWGGELSEVNTLEMLEWQRIARMRSLLRRAEDVHGRTIYTDEQMSTYLVQFERDFGRDAAKGLRVIDATEGGVRKLHTTTMTLAEALEQHAGAGPAGALALPAPGVADARARAERLERVAGRLRELRRESGRVGDLAREATGVLREMLERHADQARVNALIGRVHDIGTRAAASPAHWLVQHVNQAGQLNRYRADRAIAAEGLTGVARQKREIERDLKNVEWLGDAAGLVTGMLDDALVALAGGPLRTREHAAAPAPGADDSTPGRGRHERARAWAFVRVDAQRSGLGLPRDLSAEFAPGMNPLRLLLARLARCVRLAGVALIADDTDTARRLAGTPPAGLRLEFAHADPRDAARAGWVGAGRAWSRPAWRGGRGNLSAADECLAPHTMAREMARLDATAGVVLGADWALTDPALTDALVERHDERPDAHPMTFAPAAPGLCGVLLARPLVEELARVGGSAATIGAILGYHPIAPQADPISKPVCVEVEPALRDALVRLIPDTPRQRERLRGALAGIDWVAADARTIVDATSRAGLHAEGPAEAITVPMSRAMNRPVVLAALREQIAAGDHPTVTLAGEGCDALEVPGVTEFAAAAGAFGASAVCVRTRLAGVGHADRRALRLADVVWVEGVADTEETYEALTGERGLHAVREGVRSLCERARQRREGDSPGDDAGAEGGPWWVVPAIEKRDEVLDEMESFYNRGLLGAGACVIEPPREARPGARVEPLPLPPSVAARLAWSRRVVRAVDVREDEHADAAALAQAGGVA